MAAADVQNIMEGLRLHQQKVLEMRSQNIAQQKADADTEAEKARIQQQRDQLDEQKRQFDLTNKAAQALHNLHIAQQTQELGTKVAQTGIAPAGATFSPAAQSSNGSGYSPINANEATSQMMNIPGLNMSIPVMKPEDYAKQQADVQTILEKPKLDIMNATQKAETERQVAVTNATQKAETKRQAIINQQNKIAEDKMNKDRIAGENFRNTQTTATQLKIAQMPYQIFNGLSPEARTAITQPSIDALRNGTMSAQQVQKEFNEKGMAGAGTAVISAFMSSGGVPPTDKQVVFNQQVKPIIDTLPLIQQYIEMLPKTKSGPGGLLTGATHPDFMNPKLDALYKQIDFNIATVAKTLGGDAGQRLQKALLAPAEGGFLPSKYKSTEMNVSNFNRLIKVIDSAIDSQLGSLPEAQRAHIKNSMGLTQIKPMGIPDSRPPLTSYHQ